jgi:NADH-quinone oxidoreductase subunit H
MHLIESQNLLATLQIVTIFAKISLFIFAFIWIRWTLPRFRYDQLMHLGWKSMIPLAIVNMLLTGGGILLFGK